MAIEIKVGFKKLTQRCMEKIEVSDSSQMILYFYFFKIKEGRADRKKGGAGETIELMDIMFNAGSKLINFYYALLIVLLMDSLEFHEDGRKSFDKLDFLRGDGFMFSYFGENDTEFICKDFKELKIGECY